MCGPSSLGIAAGLLDLRVAFGLGVGPELVADQHRVGGRRGKLLLLLSARKRENLGSLHLIVNLHQSLYIPCH